MKINFKKINHIQICIPKGEETKGREFYCGILGLQEIEKPESLKKNGGFWLARVQNKSLKHLSNWQEFLIKNPK